MNLDAVDLPSLSVGEDGYVFDPAAIDNRVAKAEAAGFTVIRSDDLTLLCDLDNGHAVAQFERVLPVIFEHFGAIRVDMWKSKSGHDHALVALNKPYPFYTRMALQAALGSDGMREALSVWQSNYYPEPSFLFQPSNAEVTSRFFS